VVEGDKKGEVESPSNGASARVPLIICGGMHETRVSAIALLAGYNIGYVLMPEQALH
jgi:hypothetical protein